MRLGSSSTCCARVSFIYEKNRADPIRSNIIFPLAEFSNFFLRVDMTKHASLSIFLAMCNNNNNLHRSFSWTSLVLKAG